jgi:Ser/Thr protein kinase RdoA (MazF antagonist)
MINPSHLLEIIQARYDLEPITHIAPLTGGEWKTLWRLDGAQRAYVVSISHPTATEASIAYEHRLLRYLQAQLPQIPAPLIASDGSSYFVAVGRIVALLPLMPGSMADGEETQLPAARFLARFQQVGVTYPDPLPRPDVSAWHAWDWYAATWPTIQAMLATTPETTDPVGNAFGRVVAPGPRRLRLGAPTSPRRALGFRGGWRISCKRAVP